MLQQIAFLSCLHLLGILLGSLVKKQVGFLFIALSGILWGILTWVLLGVTLLSIGVPYTIHNMAIFIAGLGLILLAINLRINTFTKRDIGWMIATTSALAAVTTLAGIFNHTVMSYDSYRQVEFSRYLAHMGILNDNCSKMLSLWGVFVPIVQSASVFLNIDYLYAAGPAWKAAMLFAFFYVSVRSLRSLDVPWWIAWATAALSIATLLCTYLFTFQFFYIHNNLPSALYLFLFVATLWIGLQEKNHAWFLFSMLALTAFTLLRTEAILTALIFLILMVSTGAITYRTKLLCFLPYCFIILAWFLKLRFQIGQGSYILSDSRIAILIALVIGFSLLILLSKLRWIEWLATHAPIMMLYALAGICLLFLALKTDLMTACFAALLDNMFWSGRWGVTWGILLTLLILAHSQRHIPYEPIFAVGIPCFFLLVYALGAFRDEPYRLGWGDSANRIFTHILPIIVFYLGLKYAPGLIPRHDNAPKSEQRRRLLLTFTLLLAGSADYTLRCPVNLARGAKVIHGPEFISTHPFDIALRGIADRKYVASKGKVPATVILDLNRMVRANVLEITQYHRTELFEDYAWHVSADGETWQDVFDTQTGETPLSTKNDGVITQFDLSDKEPFRFVKLTLRSAKGQNRLLLKRLSVYSNLYNKLRQAVADIR